ncbi:MAG: glycosyltransferase family 25 protein [Gammaproteobacteria bacterium]
MTAKLPPVYVISLSRETARRENIKSRLNALGANYQIIDAVDGKTLTPPQYAHRLQPRRFQLKEGVKITLGEIGCFMSHHNLWRQIADGKDECALILEDDAVWDDDFAEVVNGVLTCEWHWEFVLLSEDATTTAGRVLCGLCNNRKLFHRYRRAFTLAAYLISRSGAAKLHDYCQTIRAPLDSMTPEFWKHGAAFYCVTPPPARQSGEESAIGHDRYNQIKRTITERALGSLLRKADRLQKAIYIMTNPPRKK